MSLTCNLEAGVAGVGQQGFVDWPDKMRMCGLCRHHKGHVLAGRPPRLHVGGRYTASASMEQGGWAHTSFAHII